MITNLFEKIKIWLKENEKEIVLAIGVFLIAVISFGLGILSQQEQVPIVIENSKYCATSSVTSLSNELNGMFVASVNGKYYHLPHCPSAKTISDKNKIWFRTKAEAEAMGYKPASNCPELQNY